MQTKQIKKAGWEKVELSKRCVGGAKFKWFLDAKRQGETGTVNVSEVFDTKGEAESWIKWAM